MQNEARNLFQVQLELVDSKVDKAVNQSISRVVEQIVSLRHEMHQEISGLRNEMHKEFSDLKGRMSAVESRLGMKNEWQNGVRTRVLDYSFRAAWLLMGIGIWFTLHSYFSSFTH
ncbi:MAG: hypothetical protein WBE18_04780 [Gammaproteobacteria bacterium]